MSIHTHKYVTKVKNKSLSILRTPEFFELLKAFAKEHLLDCIVLGCTDFPTLLQEQVHNKFAYADLGLDPGVQNKLHFAVELNATKKSN